MQGCMKGYATMSRKLLMFLEGDRPCLERNLSLPSLFYMCSRMHFMFCQRYLTLCLGQTTVIIKAGRI